LDSESFTTSIAANTGETRETPVPRGALSQDKRPPRIISSMSASPSSAQIDPALLEMLRCPLTRSKLRLEGEFLVAEVGGLSYPVRDGFPVMLIEEAKLPAGIQSLDELKTKLHLG
jgi:uncharacterized protein YbaR (Trm112 family)